MLSRSAERIYWLARYMERTENIARLVNVYMNLLYDLPRTVEVGWHTLILITEGQEHFYKRYKIVNERNITRFLLADKTNPGSLFSSLNLARENIRTSRELVPDEAWEQVNEMFLFAKANLETLSSRSGRAHFLQEMAEGCQRFTGLLSGAMSHNNPYHFIRIGRNLERADMTTRILDVGSVLLAEDRSKEMRHYESMLWINVLKSLSALLMYRQHVRTRIKGADVLDYLIKDEALPRSVSHCIEQVRSSVVSLPSYNALPESLNELNEYIQGLDVKRAGQQQLHQILDDIQARLGGLHMEIAATWFTLKPSACTDQ